jgi:hypothetical protein
VTARRAAGWRLGSEDGAGNRAVPRFRAREGRTTRAGGGAIPTFLAVVRGAAVQ